MKKGIFIFLLSAVIMTASAVSCGNNSSDKEKPDKNSSADADDKEHEDNADDSDKDSDEDRPSGNETVDINDYITSDQPRPALWKATDPDTGNSIYLMGTIHVVGENTFPLPDYIMDVYDDCDAVAVEYDIDTLENDLSLMQDFLLSMTYSDGTTIEDHLSAETVEKAGELFKDMGMPLSAMKMYQPGFWISQLETSALLKIDNLSNDGVDAAFMQYAKDDGKDIVSIETLDTQVSAMLGYSDDLADYVLSETADTIDDLDSMAGSFGELYNFWADGDIDALMTIEEEMEQLPKDLRDDYEDYYDIMLFDRNEGMADRAAEFIRNGDNYFFMVGAMHFAGDRGVDDLLEDMGFNVERVK